MAATPEPPAAEGNAECGICLMGFEEDEHTQILPCGHAFHEYCVMQLAVTKEKHWADVPCSMCRSVPNELAAINEQMDAWLDESDGCEEVTISDGDGGEEVEQPEEDAGEEEEADEAEEEEDASVLRRPASAAAKAKTKPGAKAKAKANTKAAAPNPEPAPTAPVAKAKTKAKAKAKGKAAAKSNASNGSQIAAALRAGSSQNGGSSAAAAETHSEPVADVVSDDVQEALVAAVGMSDDEALICMCCGDVIAEGTEKIIAKSRKEFVCHLCFSQRSMFYRNTGSLPCTSSLSIAERNDFWHRCRTTRSMEDKNALLSAYSQQKRYTDTSEEYAEGGQFLPLNVWRTKGFPVDRIEQHTKPEDIQEDRVVGVTYRVVIRSRTTKRKHGDIFEDVAYFAADGDQGLLSNPRGSGASSSSSARPLTSVAINAHIAEERERCKSAKAQEKLKSNELKKVSLNLNKSLAAMQKLKSEIKDEKLPLCMKEDNALTKVINEGKALQDMVAAGSSDNAQVMRNKVDQFGTMSIDSELAIMNVCSVLDRSRVDSEFALMQVYRQFAIMNV